MATHFKWGSTRAFSTFKYHIALRGVDYDEALAWRKELCKPDYGSVQWKECHKPPKYEFVFDDVCEAMFFKLTFN